MVVGHSMGGLTALLLAQSHPDQVSRLMIVDALPFFPVIMDPNATVEQARPIAAMMRDKVAAAYGKPQDPATIAANVKSLALKPDSLVKMTSWSAAADPRVTASALYEDMTTDARPALSTIKAPITVVVPWSETVFGREKTVGVEYPPIRRRAKVQLRRYRRRRALPTLDQPAKFAEELKRFGAVEGGFHLRREPLWVISADHEQHPQARTRATELF